MSDDCRPITSNSFSTLQFGNPFLHSYQRRTLDIDEQKPRDKVDTLRFCLSQQKFLQLDSEANSSFQHDFSLQRKSKNFEVQYSMLLDSKEALNSYAAPALSLSKNFINESKKWKCQIDLEKLENEMPESTVRKEIPDEEYLKLLKLMKETVPKKAGDIKLNYLKKEKYLKVDDAPDFNMFDRNSLVSMGLDTTDVIASSNNDSSFYFAPKVKLEVKNKSFELMPLSNPEKLRDAYADRTSFSSSHVGSRPQPSTFFGNIPQGNVHESEESTHRRVTKKNSRKYPWEIIRENSNETAELQRQNSFKTASQQLAIENCKKFGARQPGQATESLYGNQKRSLGTRRGISSKFTPPVRRNEEKYGESSGHCLTEKNNSGQVHGDSPYAEMMLDDRMKNIDVKMVELIMNEIMDNGPPVTWDDIAGLDLAKNTIKEIVVWPMLRPDIFTGLRGPPKGLLLFGPPGTGKTMIGKCIASQSHSTFFSISASSLTSKWVGEGEKMVRAMFAVAKYHQPAVIFIDEIDSLLTQRSESEHESSRRIKTEFLVQLDGATSGDDERLLVVGATNRPQELDEAARRRLVKRLYIPLPEIKARQQIIINLLSDQNHTLSSSDIEEICIKADGYSGADMANLCREAALGPIRSLNFSDIQHISVDEVRAISRHDFISALDIIRASVSDDDLHLYTEWNKKYGINPK